MEFPFYHPFPRFLNVKETLNKIGYGLIFCLLLPAVLVGWARGTTHLVPLPVPIAPGLGGGLALVGVALVVGGMADLWFRGHGLPMTAFPPVRLVTAGFYRLLAHPIYVGATLISAGASLVLQSASGLWLVTPTLTLAWLALTTGFENADLARRFPTKPYTPLLATLPPDSAAPALWPQRLAAAALAFGPWLLGYEVLIFLGPSSRPISTFLPPEITWPVWPWTVALYALAYPFTVLAPFTLRTQTQLRTFVLSAVFLTTLGLFLQVSLPLVAAPRAFVGAGFWAEWLRFERAIDGSAGAWPSFHVAWALVAAHTYGRQLPKLKGVAYAVALIIVGACLTTGMHSLSDVLAGSGLGWAARHADTLGRGLRVRFERLANAWVAWQVGPVRILNHSLYAALAMALGTGVTCALLGAWPPMTLTVGGGLLGAGVWGQLVEGGRGGLSRPFGYYGSLLGGLLGAGAAAWWFNQSLTELLGAAALTCPLVQGVGRLRCVVQGCCHGSPITTPAAAGVGIRVWHPKSRVVAVSGLGGQPIHAAPAYSMFANVLIAGLLWRLWYEGATAPLLIGIYFIGSGAARFIEEAYRGEVQTPVFGRLKLYQWLALASVLVGIGATLLLPPVGLAPYLRWAPAYGFVAALAGATAGFALGVDFPFSNRRFSRLAT